MKKLPYLGLMIAFAFLAFLCGATIDSAWADNHHANTWLYVGVISFGIATVGMIIAAAKTPKA